MRKEWKEIMKKIKKKKVTKPENMTEEEKELFRVKYIKPKLNEKK